jgi:hypothetical protein
MQFNNNVKNLPQINSAYTRQLLLVEHLEKVNYKY